MTTQEVIEVLTEAGYEVHETENVRNSISMHGVIVVVSEVSPVLYEAVYSGIETRHELLEVVESLVEQMPEIDIDELFTREFFENHAYVCMQRQGTEDLVKRPYLDLEEYVRLAMTDENFNGECMSIKVQKKHLDLIDMTEDELFTIAEKNTHRVAKMRFVADVLKGFIPDDIGECPPFMIISTETGLFGSSTILFTDILHYICDQYHVDTLIVLPSSIHEILVVVGGEECDKEYYNEMVRSINNECVGPCEVLADHCYIYRKATDDYIY